MFDRIAGRYDLLNRLLSLGADQSWRRRTARALELSPGALVLDVASGTADLAIVLARHGPDVRVEGIDPSPRMLALGREKVRVAGLEQRVHLQEGVAERLPFPDSAFDAVTIAFGIRNLPDRRLGLREMIRVLKPRGRLAVLELTRPEGGPLGWAARLWVRAVVPVLGAALSSGEEYEYLKRSIEAFPPRSEFADLMSGAGLTLRRVAPLSFGACVLFVGELRPR